MNFWDATISIQLNCYLYSISFFQPAKLKTETKILIFLTFKIVNISKLSFERQLNRVRNQFVLLFQLIWNDKVRHYQLFWFSYTSNFLWHYISWAQKLSKLIFICFCTQPVSDQIRREIAYWIFDLLDNFFICNAFKRIWKIHLVEKKIIFIQKKCTNHWMQIRLMKNTQIPLWARIHFAESNVFVRIRTSLVRLNSPNQVQRRFQISFQRRFVAIITQTLTRVTHLQKDNSREFVMKLPTKGTDKPLLPNRLLYKINLGSSLFYSKQKSLVEIDPAKIRSTRKE